MPLVGVPDRLNGMCNTFRCTDIPASRVGEVSYTAGIPLAMSRLLFV